MVGYHHGFFDPAANGYENQEVLAHIRNASPDILLVGMGMPLQERWLLENWNALHVPVGLNGGAALSYVAGNTKRAPEWMIRHGLEWLGRMLIEPKRLWKRYFIGNSLFLWRVLVRKPVPTD